MLDPDPVDALALCENHEGEAPQPSRETRKVTAYYMGITLFENVRSHAFIKFYSNRGMHSSGDPDPHGQDRQMGYICLPSKDDDSFVRGAPYTFTTYTTITQGQRACGIICPTGEITLSTEGPQTLPFIQGHITPYLRDQKFVLFYPHESIGVF